MREEIGPDGSSPICYNGSHGWWSGQSTWAAAIPDGGSIGVYTPSPNEKELYGLHKSSSPGRSEYEINIEVYR
jgi:hypothetical protein